MDTYDFADGKYTVVHDQGKLIALRYGEPWQDLAGNNLVYYMLMEVLVLRNALSKACGDDSNIVNEYIASQRD